MLVSIVSIIQRQVSDRLVPLALTDTAFGSSNGSDECVDRAAIAQPDEQADSVRLKGAAPSLVPAALNDHARIGPVTTKLCKSAKGVRAAARGLYPARLWTEGAFGKELAPQAVARATTQAGIRDRLDRRSVKSSPLTR
jgi:hypothetical protein